ncbi:MAG: hypothetical protein AABM33_07390 [Pseudomonadota bacterium]
MIRNLVFSLVFWFAGGAAQAQFRTLPEDAKRGVMRHVEGMTVEIDGKKLQLAAGTQIRDGGNMIVVPAAVPPGVLIKYLPDAQGRVARIWILSPQEAAQPDPKK